MRASWTAAAIIVAALALPVAAEAATAWRVSGTITGPYDSSMSWVNCPLQGAVASFSEHADVDVKMRPRFKSDFPRGSFRFGALVVGDVGGRWSLNGTYPPRQGSEGCGAPVAASCGGAVVGDQGRNSQAQLVLDRRGRSMVGDFISFFRIGEDASDLTTCGAANLESGQIVPFLGINQTNVESRAALAPVIVPISRLNGRRAFSVAVPPREPLDECPAFYASCTHSGDVRMTLTFTPAR